MNATPAPQTPPRPTTLRSLAGERIATTLLAPNGVVVYRPMTVREPFGYAERTAGER
jgi:hypothetical protein